MLQNRLFFALASRSGFGATISDAIARISLVFCNSVSADRIGMAASRLLLALAACVMSFAALVSVLHVVSPAGLLRGFTEATIATSIPPGTGGAKLCSASSMVEAALESHTSTAASVQPPVVND